MEAICFGGQDSIWAVETRMYVCKYDEVSKKSQRIYSQIDVIRNEIIRELEIFNLNEKVKENIIKWNRHL